MTIKAFDHVNIRTANLEAMVKWYGDILGLKPGRRPDFSFPGAWLYIGEQAMIHFVGVENQPGNIESQIEHFALSADGLTDFLRKLDSTGTPYSPRRLPGNGALQVNVHDPDGNHIHVDFSPEEADAAGM